MFSFLLLLLFKESATPSSNTENRGILWHLKQDISPPPKKKTYHKNKLKVFVIVLAATVAADWLVGYRYEAGHTIFFSDRNFRGHEMLTTIQGRIVENFVELFKRMVRAEEEHQQQPPKLRTTLGTLQESAASCSEKKGGHQPGLHPLGSFVSHFPSHEA